MLEVIIAVFLTAVGVMSVFSLVAPSLQTVGRSDYMGRASGILYEQLMREEARLMNSCCKVTTGTLPAIEVNTSGQATATTGDAKFNVTTSITSLDTNIWRVTVRVAWPGHTGVSESLVVSRQEGFTFPSGCTIGEGICQ